MSLPFAPLPMSCLCISSCTERAFFYLLTRFASGNSTREDMVKQAAKDKITKFF